MQVRRVYKQDLSSINKWLKRQNHPQATHDMLPSLGFIVPGVAAGFIRDCETGIGMIDSYVSNPLCSPASRNKALDAITNAVLKQPFKQFITMTADSGLQKRFLSHAFGAAPQYLFFFKGAQ